MDELATIFMAAITIKAILDWIADIVRRTTKRPDLNLAWFDAIGLAAGLAIAWFAPLNAFAAYLTNQTVGVILTGLLIGGGTSLLNQVFATVQGRVPTPEYYRAAAERGPTAPAAARRGW